MQLTFSKVSTRRMGVQWTHPPTDGRLVLNAQIIPSQAYLFWNLSMRLNLLTPLLFRGMDTETCSKDDSDLGWLGSASYKYLSEKSLYEY